MADCQFDFKISNSTHGKK